MPRKRSPEELPQQARREDAAHRTARQKQVQKQVLTQPSYRDPAIPQVWARELDEGRYWCSVSTMYRIARAAGQVRERPPVAAAVLPSGCTPSGYLGAFGLVMAMTEFAQGR